MIFMLFFIGDLNDSFSVFWLFVSDVELGFSCV